jgi:hypothetical protein
MPTNLAAPLKVEEFAHGDTLLVEYVLDPKTRRVLIQPSGAACRVSVSGIEGGALPTADFLPIADGGLDSISFARVDEPARVAGRSILVALEAPGNLRILSARG